MSNRITSLIAAALFAMPAVPAIAQTGFTFQGRVRDNGVLLDRECDMDIRLYDVESGGTALEEINFFGSNTVDIQNGLFSVYLDFDPSYFDGRPLWLEVEIECPPGDPIILAPRQPLDQAPYAIHALSGGEWTNVLGDLVFEGGRVGIGTSSPAEPLHVFGQNPAIQLTDQSVGTEWALRNLNGVLNFDRIQDGDATTRVTFASSGHIGRGTTNPARGLHIKSEDPNGCTIRLERGVDPATNYFDQLLSTAGAGGLQFVPNSSGTPSIFMPYDGGVGVGTASPSQTLTVSGTFAAGGKAAIGTTTLDGVAVLNVNGSIRSTSCSLLCSDRRFKMNIEPLADALRTVSELEGVRFDWRVADFPERTFEHESQLGLIAQDVVNVVPEAARLHDDGTYSVSYTHLIPLLIEGVKELNTIVESKDAQLADQQTQIHDLTERLAAMEAMVEQLATHTMGGAR